MTVRREVLSKGVVMKDDVTCKGCKSFTETSDVFGLCSQVNWTVFNAAGKMTVRNVLVYGADTCRFWGKKENQEENIDNEEKKD
jgi:hypothetical protein